MSPNVDEHVHVLVCWRDISGRSDRDRGRRLRDRLVPVPRRAGHATREAGGQRMSEGSTAEERATAGSDSATEPGTGEADSDVTKWLPYLGIVALYTATVLGGLALTDEMRALGLVMFEDPGNVGNVGVFAVYVLVATGVMVLAFRHEVGDVLVRVFLLGSAGILTAAAFVAVTGIGTVASDGAAVGLPTSPVSGAVALGTAALLWVYPEWWVNDAAAVVFGAAAIPMLGLGFGPLPVVVLLVLWAGYDAYAVYVSGHMQELAAGLGGLRAPIVFVVPHSLSYSLREEGLDLAGEDEEADDEGSDGRHDVALLGLGDALIPGMLAVSAGTGAAAAGLPITAALGL
ncbi:hypothetical protein BRC67_05470 [Halobacteriales archaeon QH_3_68_24]|nr:MAG: hypothetical protein BRC67_05470 [Halobacteriales archaeon QH_3_68_24]